MQVYFLLARATGNDSIRLSWGVPPYVASGYVIFRGTTDVFEDSIQLTDAVPPDVDVYNDYGLVAGTTYYYWVLIPTFDPVGPTSAATFAAPVPGPKFEDLLLPLYTWASAVTGKPVIWAHQSGLKPLKPFVELMLTGPIKVPGTDHTTEHEQMVSGMRRWNVSVHCFTDPVKDPSIDRDAMSYAADLIASLDDVTVTDVFNAAQMGCADVNPVTDVSALLETKYERHAQFDFSINVPSNVLATVKPDVIDTVSLPNLS